MKRFFAPMAVFVIALGIAAPLWAQEAPPEVLARIYHVSAKAGSSAQLEAAIGAHAKWRMDHGDPWKWDVYQVVNGEGLGDFFIYSGEHSWADMDAYADFLNKGSVHFNTVVGPHMAALSSVITRTDTKNIRWPEDPAKARLLQLISYRIKLGHGRDFNESIAKIHEAIVKTNWPVYYGWEYLLNGGPGPEATLALPAENWAAMKSPAKPLEAMLAEALGADEAKKLLERFVSSIDGETSWVVLHRPDLSVTSK